MATDAWKTAIGGRNVTVQSPADVVWLEVEAADGQSTTTIALTATDAAMIARALESQAIQVDKRRLLEAEQLLG